MDTNLDPTAMTSPERIAVINDARSRLLKGDDLSDDELRYAIRLMTSERKLAPGAKAKKVAPAPAQLSDF